MSHAGHEVVTHPHYVLAQLDVKNLGTYRAEYIQHVVPLITQWGGTVLVASTDAEPLEGQWFGGWTVVLRFPSREAALGWYAAAEYAPLKELRLRSLTHGGNLALVPGRE
jgi:uncharacterized protein (DUF1330 family)